MKGGRFKTGKRFTVLERPKQIYEKKHTARFRHHARI